jgi:hypothetical protein
MFYGSSMANNRWPEYCEQNAWGRCDKPAFASVTYSAGGERKRWLLCRQHLLMMLQAVSPERLQEGDYRIHIREIGVGENMEWLRAMLETAQRF